MSLITAHDWSLIAYVIGVLVLSLFMLTVPQLLGGRDKGVAKNEPFESGVVEAGGARMRLSAKFYLIAMFFVLFDVEALFLYAWATAVRQAGWAGFIEVTIFITVLLIGLVYIWRLGALQWSPENHIIAVKKQAAIDSGAPFSGPLNLAEVTRFTTIEELERDATGKVPAQLSGQMYAAQPAANHAVDIEAPISLHKA